MSDTTVPATAAARPAPAPLPSAQATPDAACDDCLGCGGWFRYEPAADPAPGVLYLSCLHCRGSGRAALPRG